MAPRDMRTLYKGGMVRTVEKKTRDYHFVARPLAEPVRSRHVSAIALPPTDELGKLLEQWLRELRGGYTIAGE